MITILLVHVPVSVYLHGEIPVTYTVGVHIFSRFNRPGLNRNAVMLLDRTLKSLLLIIDDKQILFSNLIPLHYLLILLLLAQWEAAFNVINEHKKLS